MLKTFLGINWRTTAIGIGALTTTLGLILNAWRTKDFSAIFTQAQTLGPIIVGLLTGFGFLSAKDAKVTGAGTAAAEVKADGTKVNVDGEVVGKQPAS